MSDERIIRDLKAQIERYNATGKLPREHDVVYMRQTLPDEEGLNTYENLPEKLPVNSEDAEIFLDIRDQILELFTKQEKAVYDLGIVGGLTGKETAEILGVSEPRIVALKDAIAKKVKGMIERTNKGENA